MNDTELQAHVTAWVEDIFTNRRDLLVEFDRLRGTNLCLKGTELELQIDRASGRPKHDADLFVEFLKEIIVGRVQL
jgi:hypothetical protein